jgi:hypothetical protein
MDHREVNAQTLQVRTPKRVPTGLKREIAMTTTQLIEMQLLALRLLHERNGLLFWRALRSIPTQ